MRNSSLLCIIGILFIGSAAMSQDVVKEVLRYEKSGKNLIDGLQSRPYENGYEVDADGFVCDNGDVAGQSGVSYWVALNQTRPEPIYAELWSRAENVSGSPDSYYSLYIDMLYEDGTPHWGLTTPFDAGTHAGQKKNLLIFPEKPVKSLTIYGLFRGKSGKVWFRDFHLSTLTIPENAGLFDSVPIIPKKQTMLQIRDVAADSDFLELKGTPFGIASDVKTNDQDMMTVMLKSSDTQDHCLTLVYAVPVSPENLTWCEHPRSQRKIEPNGEYSFTTQTAAGVNGRLSYYPFAAVASAANGRAVGIDMGSPAFFRTGYNARSGELFVAVDVALTRESPTATLKFVAFDFRGYQAFRGALAKYHELFPQYFECKTPEQGNWMPFAKISRVPNHEDFGFKFKEGNDEVAWDDAHDIITFRYTEPMTWWMSMPDDVAHNYDNAVAIARKLADGGNARAKALFTSGMHDENGRFVCQLLDTPWCKGAVWSINDMPGIPDGNFALQWNDDLARRLYSNEGFTGLDGEYVDSSEGYVTAELDFNRNHFAVAGTPLTFSRNSRQPAIYRGLVTFEYCRKMSQDVHNLGKLMMANATPHSLCWLAPLFDVMGTETNWNYNGRWSPMSDERMLYCRALCGPKPYCFLMNTDFTKFGYAESERFMKRSLAYGMFPGYFSEDAATGHYFTRPELYERDRPLFKKYLPLCKQVAEAGWQPLTFAQTDNDKVYVERFGKVLSDSIYTVFNDSDETVNVTVRFRPNTTPSRFTEAVSVEEKTVTDGRISLKLGSQDVAMLVPNAVVHKVLIVTGGHGFDVKEFYEMFDALPGITYDKAVLPKEMDLLAPGLEKKYDAIVSYDMNQFPITDEQRANFEKLIHGGMPLLVFHHSIGGYKDWPKYREIAGGQYIFANLEADGKTWPPSDYKHDVEMKIAVADKDHAITKGVSDFTILDEAYKDVYVKLDAHILLTTDNPHATKQVAWTYRFGNAPVFTLMLGHDKHAFANENLRKLLKQGIDWMVAERKVQSAK